ncbi:hypothetical protein WK31_15540 [Burkholderia vietnamiensis]|nr:hypothetical protein WK31_15540 [Burkholderia vietnamiensis]KVF10605.1 hypothetical protein WJ04_03555 [Burkholderia vietnamiensis]
MLAMLVDGTGADLQQARDVLAAASMTQQSQHAGFGRAQMDAAQIQALEPSGVVGQIAARQRDDGSDASLLLDAAHVAPRGIESDAEMSGNGLVAESATQQIHDFFLSRRESRIRFHRPGRLVFAAG